MKITTLILGISLAGGSYLPIPAADCCNHAGGKDSTDLVTIMNDEFEAVIRSQAQTCEVDISSLEIVETEAPVDLGFDTSEYLPEGFDAYAGKIASYPDPGLVYVETEIDLGFDTAPYLPAGFNAYEGMTIRFSDLDQAELEAALFGQPDCPVKTTGGDTGTDDVATSLEDLNLAVIEEAIDLGFDTTPYLPADFDPYQGMAETKTGALPSIQ